MNKNVKMSLFEAQKIFYEEFDDKTKRAIEHHLLAELLWNKYILSPTERNHQIYLNVCRELFNTS